MMVRVPWWVLVLAAINAAVLAYVVHWNTETLSRAILSLVALIAADAVYRVLRDAADDGARLHARVGSMEEQLELRRQDAARERGRMDGITDRMDDFAGMLAGIREDFEHLEETLGKRMDFADALPAQMDALRTGGHAALAKAMAAADDVAELHQRVKAHEQGTEDADRTLSEHIKAEVQRRVALEQRLDETAGALKERITALETVSVGTREHVRALDARLDAMDAEALSERITSLEQKRGVLR